MFALPDIPNEEACRVAGCLQVIDCVLDLARIQIQGQRDPSDLFPDLDRAKFFALGAHFLIIQGPFRQDLSYKTFYDLTGSGGRAGLAAVFLHRWRSVVCLESCVAKHDVAVMARRIVQRMKPLQMVTKAEDWTIQHTTFKRAEWIDGDVLFFDATVFGTLDEGILCRYLQHRLRALQAGSFVVLFTRCGDCLIHSSHLEVVNRFNAHHVGRSGEQAEFTSWLLKVSG